LITHFLEYNTFNADRTIKEHCKVQLKNIQPCVNDKM